MKYSRNFHILTRAFYALGRCQALYLVLTLQSHVGFFVNSRLGLFSNCGLIAEGALSPEVTGYFAEFSLAMIHSRT